MGLLSNLLKYSGKYRDLEKLAAKQKDEIRRLKEEHKAYKAQAALKLAETLATVKADFPRVYPLPRLLVATPGSEGVVDRFMELTGLVIAARMARRSVLVDWRDGTLAEPGRNAYQELFYPAPEMTRYTLRSVDRMMHQREAPKLPENGPAAPEALAEWRECFLPAQTFQVLHVQGSLQWREHLAPEWLPELTFDERLFLDDVERMAVLSLWRPKTLVRDLAAPFLTGKNPNKCLGVYLPGVTEAGQLDLARRVQEELERRQAEYVWLLADSGAQREVFKEILGNRVELLDMTGQGPAGTLAACQCLSHAAHFLLAPGPAVSRLVYMLSGVRPVDVAWLEPDAATVQLPLARTTGAFTG